MASNDKKPRSAGQARRSIEKLIMRLTARNMDLPENQRSGSSKGSRIKPPTKGR